MSDEQRQELPAAAGSSEEDAFDVISCGNDLSEAGDHWAASSAYHRASCLLAKLAEETRKDAGNLRTHACAATSSTTGKGGIINGDGMVGDFRSRIRKAVELERIQKLYDGEARDYYVKARKELIHALQSEMADGESTASRAHNVGPGGAKSRLSTEQSIDRRRIFELTFGNTYTDHDIKADDSTSSAGALTPKQDEATQTDGVDIEEDSTDDQQGELSAQLHVEDGKADAVVGADHPLDIPAAPISNTHSSDGGGEGEDKQVSDIEARLASFESTIPSALKSDEERVRDLNAGLKGLGYHLPTSPDIKRHLGIHAQKPMTDEEHIQRIVEMAKDEARLEGTNVDEDAVKAAFGGIVGTGGGRGGRAGGGVGGEDDDVFAINDEDDLAAVLRKAHLNVNEGNLNKSSIGDMLADASKVRDEAGGMSNLTQTGKILNLIASAQEHLFEASAHLEEEDDDASEGDDSDAYDDDGMLLSNVAPTLMTAGMVQGKANILEAKKAVDEILRSWPKGDA